MTIAATLATAPLIAFHFEDALDHDPARQPAGPAGGGAGDVAGDARRGRRSGPGLPGRGAERARRAAARLHRPGRRLVRAPELGLAPRPARRGGLVASYLASARRRCRARCAGAATRLARAAGAARSGARRGPSAWRALVAVAGWRRWPRRGAGASAARAPGCGSRSSTSARATRSCCSRPARPAVLVDGGPPGDDLAAKLRAAGVERLGAAVVTHEQSDHAGGIEELLGRVPVERLALRAARPALLAEARAAGADRRGSRGRRAALRPPAARGALAAPRAARRAARRRRPESAGAGPARPLARLLDAAHRRRRGGGGAARPRAGRRAQGRPPRQRRRRPRRAARPHRGRGSR